MWMSRKARFSSVRSVFASSDEAEDRGSSAELVRRSYKLKTRVFCGGNDSAACLKGKF